MSTFNTKQKTRSGKFRVPSPSAKSRILFYFFQSRKSQGIWEKCLKSGKSQGILIDPKMESSQSDSIIFCCISKQHMYIGWLAFILQIIHCNNMEYMWNWKLYSGNNYHGILRLHQGKSGNFVFLKCWEPWYRIFSPQFFNIWRCELWTKHRWWQLIFLHNYNNAI